MALLHAQSFEAYDVGSADQLEAEGYSVSDAEACSIVADGWNAQRALAIAGADESASLEVTISSATSVLCIQVALKLGALAEATLLEVTVPELGGRFAIAALASGAVQLLDSDDEVVATSPTGSLRPDTWHYLELKAELGASGRALFVIDGALCADLTAIDFGTDDPGVVTVHLNGTAAGARWSELLVFDGSGNRCSDLLGRRARITLLRPVADGAETGWTASEGDRWATLDEPFPAAHDEDTYVSSSSAGQENTVLFEAAPAGAPIEAIAIQVTGYHDGSLTPRPRLRQGSSTVSGPEQLSGDLDASTYAVVSLISHSNPADQRPWTRATLATMRAGMITEAIEGA